MSNMSYCRFRNTNLDVQDCMETLTGLNGLLDEIEWLENVGNEEAEMEEAMDTFRTEQLSPEEARAALHMIEAFMDTMADLGIIEDWDYSKADELLDRFTK